jgi:hypothetical protein
LHARKIWLLRLVFPGRWGRWLTGAVIFAAFSILFTVAGRFDPPTPGGDNLSPGAALFFCIIFAYIVPIHHYIIERCTVAFDQVSNLLEMSEEDRELKRQRITVKPMRWSMITFTVGLLAGIAHNLLLLSAEELPTPTESIADLLPTATTLLIWLVMTTVVASLSSNALLFRRLANQVRFSLLDTRALTPFGSVAVSSTLALIGAQAAFPAMMLDADYSITYLPGLIATGVPMIFLFLLPILPVHRRILSAKRDELARLTAEITAIAPDASRLIDYERVNPLLTYRREIAGVPEWPFDTSVMSRLAIYLIIPPLTWIGAALIEILIDSAL